MLKINWDATSLGYPNNQWVTFSSKINHLGDLNDPNFSNSNIGAKILVTALLESICKLLKLCCFCSS